ncbi:MAG TPA: hypothetical protein VEV82_09955 [Actinomycetota bacterium]|nr:hypothetical protein [Actinomycetota bacterium]
MSGHLACSHLARRASGDRLVDNPWQLPGEFVVDQNSKIRLAYHYNYCENYPDPQVLIASIKLATLDALP